MEFSHCVHIKGDGINDLYVTEEAIMQLPGKDQAEKENFLYTEITPSYEIVSEISVERTSGGIFLNIHRYRSTTETINASSIHSFTQISHAGCDLAEILQIIT
jgi:hypothetical protein